MIAAWAFEVDPLVGQDQPDPSSAMKKAAVPVIQPGEEVVVRALAPINSGTLKARAVNSEASDKGQSIELFDDGDHSDGAANDGLYAARHAGFDAEGLYRITLDRLADVSAAVPPAKVEVGYRIKKGPGLEPKATLATISHGGGGIISPFFADYGRAKRAGVVSIRNARKVPCKVTVRTLYPADDPANLAIIAKGETRRIPLTERPDPYHQILLTATAPPVKGADAPREADVCSFTLPPGEETSLDLEAALPEKAQNYLDTGEAIEGVEPKLLSRISGAILQIRVDWKDGVSREIDTPIRVKTRALDWVPIVGVVLGLIIVALIARFALLPLWRKHKARRNEGREETEAGDQARPPGLLDRLFRRRPDMDLDDDDYQPRGRRTWEDDD